MKHIFGWQTFLGIKRDWYNSMVGIVGLWLLTDTWSGFFGSVLVLEAILVSIEGTWTKNWLED